MSLNAIIDAGRGLTKYISISILRALSLGLSYLFSDYKMEETLGPFDGVSDASSPLSSTMLLIPSVLAAFSRLISNLPPKSSFVSREAEEGASS